MEELVESDTGPYYQLDFVFGPSGTYFRENYPFKLTLKGKYIHTGTDVWLYDENGEALEGTRYEEEDKLVFDIPHFSSYSYDNYDEY
jgi:hypothetical protein